MRASPRSCGVGHRGGHRQPLPVEPVAQHRGVAPRCPGRSHRREERDPRFVLEDDPRPASASPLFIRGQSSRDPAGDRFVVSFHRPTRRPLTAPTQLVAQQLPHVPGVIAHPGVGLDHRRHPLQRPQIGGEPVRPRPLAQRPIDLTRAAPRSTAASAPPAPPPSTRPARRAANRHTSGSPTDATPPTPAPHQPGSRHARTSAPPACDAAPSPRNPGGPPATSCPKCRRPVTLICEPLLRSFAYYSDSVVIERGRCGAGRRRRGRCRRGRGRCRRERRGRVRRCCRRTGWPARVPLMLPHSPSTGLRSGA